ncbi:MAG: VOC family protein [Chloroflexi bacterium]|nr:VOC family protein [Chloroflexota bacterium]
MLAGCPFSGFALTSHPDAARAFYRDVLGLALLHEDDFGMEFEVAGARLRVSKIEAFEPAAHTIAGWTVGDIAAMARELVAKGVQFNHYPGMPQDQLGVWSPDGATKVAWFKDPDGNTLSLTQVG